MPHDNAAPNQNRTYVWLIGFTAAIGGFLFGYDTGVIGGAMPALEKHFQLDAAQLGFAVASVFVGSIAGALCGGWLSDLLGRRRVLVATGISFLASALLAGLAQAPWQFNVGRFVGGIGIGISLPIVGVYLAEIAPARVRGRVVSLNQLVITFGILVSYVVGWATSNLGDAVWQTHDSWRWAFGSQAIPSVLFVGALLLIPESPRWLIQKGRIAEAIEIMSRVDGREQAIAGVEEIRQVIAAEDVSVLQLFKPGLRIALTIGIMLSLFDQITGINIVIYYIQKILLQLGFTEQQARQGMLLLGVNNFATTILALAIVDRVGRRPLLIFCPVGMGICMFLVGLQFFTGMLPPIFVLFAIMAYCFCYALGPGPVNLLILAEIFPTHVRGQAAGVSTIFLWVSCYVISERFPRWLAWSEAGTFWTLTAMCLLYSLFCFLAIPETKGKTLEQIEQHWASLLRRKRT
jgi:SP family arabinose:H+ symporter-like MFS transporter